MHSFTNTIVDHKTQNSLDKNTEASCELIHDDVETLYKIISEINDLNNETIHMMDTNQPSQQPECIGSVSEALGDYNLVDFDVFDSSIQLNDPMLGNNQLNIY